MQQQLTQEAFERFVATYIPRLKGLHPDWPSFACGLTVTHILGDLQGTFEGNFYRIDGTVNRQGHSWIVDRVTKNIIDPTVGQFDFYSGPTSRIFTPDDPEYQWYVSW